jgi:anti-anti-sigma factor
MANPGVRRPALAAPPVILRLSSYCGRSCNSFVTIETKQLSLPAQRERSRLPHMAESQADFKMDWSDGNLQGERILQLTGPFTLAAVFDFQDLMRTHHPPITIIDLTGVPYMDSAALGSLLGLHVSCQKDGRKYALIGASDRLRTLFRVAGVNTILIIYSSLADADAGLSGSTASA